MNKETEGKQPTLFDEMNAYLKKEAPKDIKNPTVEGIAERMVIPEETLNLWLANDQQFKEELTRLKNFQITIRSKTELSSIISYTRQGFSLFWMRPRRDMKGNEKLHQI
jgi:hypothetical protein